MTRPKPPLHRHLLTRSDLAELEVPAGDVLSWLADGSIEQVGVLPDGNGGSDQVFAVPSAPLRQELATRLVDLGKPNVVLTPARVRSFLVRTMQGRTAAAGDEPAEFADVLHEVVSEVEADVDHALRLDGDEERREATQAGDEATPANETAAPEDAPADEDTEPGDFDACFDADDLAEALGGLELADASPSVSPTAPAPMDEAVMVAAPTVAPNGTTVDLPAADHVLARTAAPEPAWPVHGTATDGITAGRPAPATLATPAAPAVTRHVTGGSGATQALERIETLLGRLHDTLGELARRPVAAPPVAAATPASVDTAPLAQAVQAGFDRAVAAMAATQDALTEFGERVGGIGAQVEHCMEKTMKSFVAPDHAATPPPAAPSLVVARADRSPIVLLALSAMVVAWSLLFWVKTGSARLALGTLVGANLVGCCLLASWRPRA